MSSCKGARAVRSVFIALLYVCVSCEIWCYTVNSITEQYEPCHHEKLRKRKH